ncbi:hypothetical protein GQ600_17422 [Phytophthora cactorum]|nr:hypothetical protein GQ600_17422 [Phytophthora cactorum]
MSKGGSVVSAPERGQAVLKVARHRITAERASSPRPRRSQWVTRVSLQQDQAQSRRKRAVMLDIWHTKWANGSNIPLRKIRTESALAHQEPPQWRSTFSKCGCKRR